MGADWRSAYLEQAKSDYDMFASVRDASPLCHSLHYLQMTTEKLAKGLLTEAGGARPAKTHDAFVRLMRTAKIRPEYKKVCGIKNSSQFVEYIDNLLDIAQQAENLSPDGPDHPNPEYPWEFQNVILIPRTYAFNDLTLESPKMIKKMIKLLKFIDDCFTIR